MKKVYQTAGGNTFTIDYADSLPSGHGHKEISVIVMTGVNGENEETKEFKNQTDNMLDYDNAMDLDGQEKYEALFDLVSHKLEDRVDEWIFSISE